MILSLIYFQSSSMAVFFLCEKDMYKLNHKQISYFTSHNKKIELLLFCQPS